MNNPLILLVDDDPDDLLLVRDAIMAESSLFTFHESNNGRHALNFLQSLSSKAEYPGLIILDINMPILNGRETLAILKSDVALKNIPVVIFTTSSNTADKEYCGQFNVPLLIKPSDMSKLSEVAKILVSYIK